MRVGARLDGAVPLDAGPDQEVALAALTRRVAELEHRLDVMKIIVGLVLAGKVLLVLVFVYVLFGSGLAARRGGEVRQTRVSELACVGDGTAGTPAATRS